MSRDDDIIVFEHAHDEVTIGDLREWHYIEVTCAAYGHVVGSIPHDFGGVTLWTPALLTLPAASGAVGVGLGEASAGTY